MQLFDYKESKKCINQNQFQETTQMKARARVIFSPAG